MRLSVAFSTLCVCFGTLAQAKSSLRSNPHPFTQEWIPGSTEKGVPQSVKGSVYVSSDGTYSYQEGTVDASAAAFGAYVDGVDNSDRPSGFGRLKITTNSTYEDKTQMRAAGYLEGALTRYRIPQHWNNWNWWIMKQFPGRSTVPDVFKTWFQNQDDWIQDQLKNNYTVQWQQSELILEQFEGLVDGYNAVADSPIERFNFQLLNAVGDLIDLIGALEPNYFPDWDKMTPKEIMQFVEKRSHCSGLIKVTGNFSELFAGHSSWFSYSSMLRIFKHYDFQVNNQHTATRRHSFSSYPGLLSSLDDFYMMRDSGLVMVQTTNPIINKKIYSKVTHKSLLAWQRVRTANQMARTGEEWAQPIKWPNSGTYENQYMVVNMKLFSPGKALPPGTLWVVEQIPGLVEFADVTQQLERGYWPSYNVPYFPTIYNESGFKDALEKFPTESNAALSGLQYQLAPRAKIFRRDQGTVVDMDSYKAIMRYNDYKNDPYSDGNPMNAICSRGDLAGSAGGCYDTKVTSWSWFQNMHASIINGPTQSHGLPAFHWDEQNGKYEDVAHEGQANLFNYDFQDEYFDE